MSAPSLQFGKSIAIAIAMVAMLTTVLAMTMDPIVAKSSR
jgi:hypothetical protein